MTPEALREALRESPTDWRTPESLSRQVQMPVEDVRALLLADEAVRRPVRARGPELDYFRLIERGHTWQEQWRRLRSALARE